MIAVRPYAEEHVPAVQAFNRRLREGGAPPEFTFPQSPVPRWLPKTGDRPVYNEFFLALEDGVVRGTYALKSQAFWIAGERRLLGYYHHPFSEGIIDRRYSTLGMQLLRDALRRQPDLFALGMGGYDRPLPRMLVALKWSHCLVPFYFTVVRPHRFLRGMRGLRHSTARRIAMDIAAFTGVGALGLHAARAWRSRGGSYQPLNVEVVTSFGPWTDEVWEACKSHYAVAAVRDAATLNVLFPADNPRFVRLRLSSGGATAGWIAVGEREQGNHPQTGDLRVGVILDGVVQPQYATAAIAAATSALAARGVDLITSNQSHAAWRRGFTELGYFEGPSNFIFAVPPPLAARVPPLTSPDLTIHLTRADGDGLYQYV